MATSYANSGGTGNRSALIWVSRNYTVSSTEAGADNLVDGGTGANNTDSTFFDAGQSGVSVIFDFLPSGFRQVIDEFKWIQSNGTGQGNWQFDGSNDAVSWTTLKSSFALVTGTTSTQSVTNSTAYRFYRLLHVGGATTSSSPFLEEIEFKLEAGAAITDPVPTYQTGNRTARITVTTTATTGGGAVANLVNGNTTENTYFWNGGQTTREVKFDFGVPTIVNEMRWYQSTGVGHGDWKWRGSNDDASYTDLGLSVQLNRPTGTNQVYASFGGNCTPYRYYKMAQTAGNTSSNPFLQEIEFREVSGIVETPASETLGITMTANLGASPFAAITESLGVNMAATVSAVAGNKQPVVCILT